MLPTDYLHSKAMQIGFINFSNEELARKNKVLQMVKDQTALDELGLGRIRDAFANLMFPGMSTLQRKAKYFVVMPSLFYQACQKHYEKLRDVRGQIVKWEIQLTEMLVKGAGYDRQKIKGITGSSVLESAKKDSSKFVKYDPAYIYVNGLRTFGIIKSNTDIYRLIFERSKELEIKRPKFKASDAEEISDSDDTFGLTQLFSTSGEVYDFERGEMLSTELTLKEALFLKNRILLSHQTTNSLLAYILRNKIPIDPLFDNLGSLWDGLPKDFEKLRLQYDMARRFSYLAYVINLRYNHIMAIYNEENKNSEEDSQAEKIENQIIDFIKAHNEDLKQSAVYEMIDYIKGKVLEPTVIEFTRRASELIEQKEWEKLDALIIKREKTIKPGRNKLRIQKYKGEMRSMPALLSFRWNEIVYSVIKDIREAR